MKYERHTIGVFAVLQRRIDGYRGRIPGSPVITVQQVIDKFGSRPHCYLTGEPIDWKNGKSFQLDHRIPVRRGGLSTLENMEVTCPAANLSKRDMTPEEFIALCKRVAELESGQKARPRRRYAFRQDVKRAFETVV